MEENLCELIWPNGEGSWKMHCAARPAVWLEHLKSTESSSSGWQWLESQELSGNDSNDFKLSQLCSLTVDLN